MKKVLFTLIMLCGAIITNAQIATENSRLFDNTYVGVEFGAATPLNLNSVLPLNTVAGIKLGKEFTPVVGLEVEGLISFNDNNFMRWTETVVKSTNVGLNGTINLSNWICRYKGTPRLFEIKTNTGLGWLHYWNTSGNALTAKTAADFNFNLGKAHTLGLTAGVWWNLNETNKIQFNKNHSQLAVLIGYTYHFKTSNGTHSFKTYDVSALLTQIADLEGRLKSVRRPNRPQVIQRVVEKVVVDTVKIENQEYTLFFAHNSSKLTAASKEQLNKVESGTTVTVLGFASPEGTPEYNLTLSQNRADVVSNYLKEKGVIVESATGLGVQGEASNRVVIVRKK